MARNIITVSVNVSLVFFFRGVINLPVIESLLLKAHRVKKKNADFMDEEYNDCREEDLKAS